MGRCSVVGDKQEKFEERERGYWEPRKDNEECNVHGKQNSKIFFFDFLEMAGMSLPFRAMSGEVKIKAQIV